MHYPTVRLTQPIHETLRAGHPWIFHDAVRHSRDHEPGDVVDVLDQHGEFVGRGLIEPDSPIRVRLWTLRRATDVDNDLLEARLRAAVKRRRFPTADTTGYRLSNGEGDRIPGLVVDVYADTAVLRVDGLAAERWLEPAQRILRRITDAEHFAVRRSEKYRGAHPAAEWVTEAPDEVVFLENGLRYFCRPIEGQKTGFFLDQRENRQRIAAASVGRRVLNLFGYTGGFSVAAAANGAAYTTTVDLAQPALDDARRNFELNSIPSPAHGFEQADVFDYLEQFGRGAAPFDVIVCDPPSFAHSRDDLARATGAYERLFARTLDVAHNGAVVALASCSSQIDRPRFLDLVTRSAREADVSYVLTGIHGAADDHPWPAAFTEGDYLQFAIGTVHRD
jgi:23S rRNA (cytosine1962-C5)-methyltransferase